MKSDWYFQQLDREFTANPRKFRASPPRPPTIAEIEEAHDAGAPWRLCECDLCDLLREIEREEDEGTN